MSTNEQDPDPTPVAPPPVDVAPSATGVIDGDADELREAPPSPDSEPDGS
jgi:hypothetical protein